MKISLSTIFFIPVLTFVFITPFGCEPIPEEHFTLDDVSPPSSPTGDTADLTLTGMGFQPIVVRTIGCGAQAFNVNSDFRVRISHTDNTEVTNGNRSWTELSNVRWIDNATVMAELTPQTLAIGWYDVQLISPTNAEYTLENGFEITPRTDTGTNDTDTGDTGTNDTGTSDTDTYDTDTDDTDTYDTDTYDTDTDTYDTDTYDTDTDDTYTYTDTDTDTYDTDTIITEFDTTLTAPLARFTILPGAGTEPTTFHFDAAGSTDAEDTFDELTFHWDWNGDGVFERTGATTQLTYYAAGTFPMVLRVTDSDGFTDYYTGPVTVVAASEAIVVTIPGDVNTPRDNEISLREAINSANSRSGPNTILIPKPMEMILDDDLPPLIDDHTTVVGSSGVILNGNRNHCFYTDSGSNGISFYWLEITNCAEAGIFLEGSSHKVSNSNVYSNSNAGMVISAENVTVGPENHIYSNAEQGIRTNNNNVTITGNFIYLNDSSGIRAESGTASLIVRQNVIQKNDYGAYIDSGVSDSKILNNTFYSNGQDGLRIEGDNQAVLNNIFSENDGHGISNLNNATTTINNNLFHKNNGKECFNCLTGTDALNSDPNLIFTNDVEIRISGSSPCINAGFDNGDDLNGPATGNFNRTAPDIGNWESPW